MEKENNITMKLGCDIHQSKW